MDISPDILDWIRKCFKALLETSNTKHLFNERRQEDYCMWVRKTKNKSKSGSTTEIFRIDNKGRKCSVLVPEGIDKFGWKSFVAMLTFKHHSHHKRLRSEVRKENFNRNYSSSDSETSRKSYARALMESSDDGSDKKNNVYYDDSSCKRSSTAAHSVKDPLRKALEYGETVIITRRLFHDDWSRIMFTLKKQTEIEFSYESFHANKAILTLSEDNANLLFQIRVQMDGQQWETPNYGGWMRFKGVPLHLWNYDSFVNIGKACGGFLAVAKETMEKENLIEAKIKGRWFIERNVNFHGTFKIEAADDFDNLNPNAEEFTFAENHAIPPENSKNQSDSKQSKPDKTSDSNPTYAKKNSSSESEYDPFDQNSDDRRKEKGKAILSTYDQDICNYSTKSKRSAKRKVSFKSPGGYSSHSSDFRKRQNLSINERIEQFAANKAASSSKRVSPYKYYQKKYYRIKRKAGPGSEDQNLSSDKKELSLTVEQGHLPPLRDLDATEDILAQVENAHTKQINKKFSS
ncbi:hypothetical protein E6C27_scaffold385G00620 [Cucumis melo var. makuwa]|uniref:Uncharacterized protein n=1 Tax=Cucumis melo var. makuwa TaxID=1194695 RepID=A0A5A7U199_CUCMM|nr:hypothetical protein E6C27_scaffold385G00620 [Cucumis melo var. makuwa]